MCPSSKITRDRIYSPKGRATLIRYWLRQMGIDGEQLADNLGQLQYPLSFVPDQRLERWNRSRARDPRYDYSHEVYDGLDEMFKPEGMHDPMPN